MRAKISATLLNVRSKPDLSGKIISQLKQEDIVTILKRKGDWYEISARSFDPSFTSGSGFIYGAHVKIIEETPPLRGKVTANLLNVRSRPDVHSNKIGTLSGESIIDVVGELGEWLEIEFNNINAFVSKKFVKLIDTGAIQKGRVTTDILNVRSQPDIKGDIAGTLNRDTVIDIIAKTGDWYETRFNGHQAYVHSDFIGTESIDGNVPDEVIPVARDKQNIKSELPLKLEPAKKLPVSGTSKQVKVATTWNKYGGLIEELSKKHNIDTAAAIAVLCVESSGKGFEKNNKNKMIIRFENHKFFHYWGKNNPQTFKKYFKYKSGKVWQGHAWRKTEKGEWQTFHGSQPKEWQVLNFARTLDDTAALYSISMGAPQIMGFHYKLLHYNTVQEMFEKFSIHTQHHIKGLFDFFDRRMIRALKKTDFETFAGYYNGSGQKEKYGKWIKEHYDAFKSIS